MTGTSLLSARREAAVRASLVASGTILEPTLAEDLVDLVEILDDALRVRRELCDRSITQDVSGLVAIGSRIRLKIICQRFPAT